MLFSQSSFCYLLCFVTVVLLSSCVISAEASLILTMISTPFLGIKFLSVELYNVIHHLVSMLPSVFDSFLTFSVTIVVVVVGVYYFYGLFMRPLNRVKNLSDIGYIVEPQESRKDVCNLIQRMRKVGDIPPVFPNGWFGLLESHRVPRGLATPINMLGLNLAVFRDEQGTVHALYAYCPHMGANLGAGGRVEKDCLVCPFHAWAFRGSDGKCVKIPYLQDDKIPDMAKVKSHIIKELNGWIYLWYDAEQREPFWDIPELETITNGDWTYRGRTEHIINSHIEEIPENGADVAHLSTVHGPSMVGGNDPRYVFRKWIGSHTWTASWESMPEPNGHIGELKLTHKYDFWGYSFPLLDLDVYARQIGPGIVFLEFSSIFGKGAYVQALTPLEPLKQKLVHNIYASRFMPTFVAKIFMLGEAVQVERDVMIWNNKQYAARPLLVKAKEDSLIGRHRRWYSQFYSENSPRYQARQKDGADW